MNNNSSKLLIAFLGGIISTVVVGYIIQSKVNRPSSKNIEENDEHINNNIVTYSQLDETRKVPEEVLKELFSRVESFFGSEGLNKLRNSFVIVVGLGGVGSHAANMIARSGVSRLRLVDFDQVTLSSLNRHAVAMMEDVGISKALTMKNKLLKIVPNCEIEAISQMFRGYNASELLNGQPDYVLDCIDDVNTKAELLSYCINNNMKVITSMGAGGKADPTKLRIGSLNDCIKDPLASKIKWKLKKLDINVDKTNIITIYSTEKATINLLPLSEEQYQNPGDFGTVDYMRLRVIPVLGTSPSMFGQAIASYVLCDLVGKEYAYDSCERMSKNLREKVKKNLLKEEKARFGTSDEVNLDDDDLEIIVQGIWGGRCPITGKRFGGHNPLMLTRWRAELPPNIFNLVLVGQSEIEKCRELGPNAFEADGIKQKIDNRLKWAMDYFKDCN